MFKHQVTQLDSGLTLVRVPMPAVSSVTVLVLVKVGSRFEKPDWWGIAHFTEHIVFKGSQNYPTAQALASAIDGVGANFNAFTSHEYTGFYVKSASTHLPLALDVLSDMLLSPNLDQADIEREKGVIIEEINMYADMPARHIANLFQQLVFDQSTLGHDIAGSKATVKAIGASDFKKFMQEWYGLANLTVVLAGDETKLNQADTVKNVESAFSKNITETRSNILSADLGPSPLTHQQYLVEPKKTEQAHFLLGFPCFSMFDDRRYALTLLATILGGNMSSRLFSEVREKRGLCYYIHSDVDLYQDVGIFGASAGVDPNRVDEAVKVTVNEFYKLVSGEQKLTAKELQKAKDYVAGKFVLELEDSESVAHHFGLKKLLYGEIIPPEVTLQRYQAVELAELVQLAAELVKPEAIRFGIIGPFKKDQQFPVKG